MDPQILYSSLMRAYGPRGWWPLRDVAKRFPQSGGYHPGDYSWPRTRLHRFEIGVGAILTQNTSWKQVENCLENLERDVSLTPETLCDARPEQVEDAITPSGYFRQKARKLHLFSRFFMENDPGPPLRENLLNLWGVGPETADSILLYAYGEPVFVIDAYTRRLTERLRGSPTPGYAELQRDYSAPFLAMETRTRAMVFNEFHALVVSHAKSFCTARPRCENCMFHSECAYPKGV